MQAETDVSHSLAQTLYAFGDIMHVFNAQHDRIHFEVADIQTVKSGFYCGIDSWMGAWIDI